MSKTVTELLSLAAELSAQGEDYCVVTVVRTANATSAKAGAKALVTADGTLHGFVGGSCVQSAVRKTALAAIRSGEARLIRVKPMEEVLQQVDTDGVELHKSSCPSGGTSDLFVEPMRQATSIVVCGASPVASRLIPLARSMGYRVTAAALAEDHETLPGAHRYLHGFDLTPLALRPTDAIVVATQGKRDREALTAALTTPVSYVGIVGSRLKVKRLRAQMTEKGIEPERLAELHGPAGLDISAIEPEEIALSILAEIIQHRRCAVRRYEPRSETTGAEENLISKEV